MIRPITCVCFLAACGSGLYLYQSKHRVRVIDAEIEQVVHQTDALREQTRILHAQWTLLDQPDRLLELSTQFLALQPTKPSQFVSMADLDSRLPAPVPPQQPAKPAEPPIGAVAGGTLAAPEPGRCPDRPHRGSGRPGASEGSGRAAAAIRPAGTAPAHPLRLRRDTGLSGDLSGAALRDGPGLCRLGPRHGACERGTGAAGANADVDKLEQPVSAPS